MHHHRSGTDDGIFTDRHPFADHGPIADPDIVGNVHRQTPAKTGPVINPVPVGIRDIDAAGHHATVSDGDLSARTDPHTGGNQTKTADGNAAHPFLNRPHRQAHNLIPRRDNRGIIPQHHRPAEHFHIPGPHEGMPPAEPFEMGRQKMMGVEILKFETGFFQAVGTMILTHNGRCWK